MTQTSGDLFARRRRASARFVGAASGGGQRPAPNPASCTILSGISGGYGQADMGKAYPVTWRIPDTQYALLFVILIRSTYAVDTQ